MVNFEPRDFVNMSVFPSPLLDFVECCRVLFCPLVVLHNMMSAP